MTAQERQAAEAMYRALGSMQCMCVRAPLFRTPYCRQCERCAAMKQWEAVELEKLGS